MLVSGLQKKNKMRKKELNKKKETESCMPVGLLLFIFQSFEWHVSLKNMSRNWLAPGFAQFLEKNYLRDLEIPPSNFDLDFHVL